MGQVYYAEHVVLARPAAIKVLHPQVAARTQLVQRFINEARAAAALQHRNIIDVYDCGVWPSPSAPGAQWYIALKFLRGRSLGSMIAEQRGRSVDLPMMVHILGEVCNGLQAAHDRGIVHRDLKPDNIFLTQTEDDPIRSVLLDFGIAKLHEDGGGVGTKTGEVFGTPAYASPEQLDNSATVDNRTDIFSLGVIAFEMLTGVRPWGATTYGVSRREVDTSRNWKSPWDRVREHSQ
jgi:serine/threonine-protein kinase